jgi:HSP20 family protein
MSLISRLFPELRPLAARSQALTPRSLFDAFDREFQHMGLPFSQAEWRQPVVDVKETDAAYVVEAELPGIGKDSLNLQMVNDTTLVLTAETKAPTPDTDGGSDTARHLSTERFYGQMTRSITFPSPVVASDIAAQLKDGILRVSVPKEPSKVSKIDIKVD